MTDASSGGHLRVYLIRHAEAQPPGSAADVDRRLTDQGVRQARAAGSALRALGVRLDGILSSPLLRACQTAQEISARLDPSPAVEIRDSLASGAGPREYFEELKGWTARGGGVAIVGHMPDLARVAAVLLAGEPEVSLAFQPSATCCIDVHGREGKLVWFHGPERLAELAGP